MNAKLNATEQDVRSLLDRWAAAELNADVETLDRILDRDFMAVGPLGFVLNKSQWLERHSSGDLKYQQFSCQDTTVRRYGEAAIVITQQTQEAFYRGNRVPMGNLRATLIVVRHDGGQVIAGLQLSAIAQPPA